ncbi:cellulose binding domain-containing protein [Streptomyces sp. McG5]|nr:cellulose binding domain-containing protein [Streptomyces sp. McG5]
MIRSWNGTLAPGASTTFGFNGTGGGENRANRRKTRRNARGKGGTTPS